MRIPYPERIPYSWATLFAVTLLVVQLTEHTEFMFALCSFAYVMVAATAFNLAGGMYRPAGAFIFFNATLTAIVGLLTKAFLGEPANSNLVAPQRTITVYLLGMVMMLVAVFVELQFRSERPLIVRYFPIGSLRGIYYGAAILGAAATLYGFTNPRVDPGLLFTILRNMNELLPFAIILGVMYIIRTTNGRKCITPLILAIMAFQIIVGLCIYSKEAVLTPPFCWAIGAGISRYRLKPINYIFLAISAFIVFYIFIPVVQVGKGSEDKTGNPVVNAALTVQLMENIHATRKEYQDRSTDGYGEVNYFNQQEGILDRLQMLSMDDLLIDEADRDGFFGYEPTIEGFENLIPHVIWRDKPNPYFGNLYAHQLGILSEDDPTTGVAFSASADAYKQGGFVAVLLVLPICFIAIFMSFSWVAGDVRGHPAAILLVLIVGHVGPEGAIPGTILLIQALAIVVGFAFICRYIFPVITSAVMPAPGPKLGGLLPITE